MKNRTPRNLVASIRQRLLDRARATNRPFQETLQYFAMERFLYRLGQSTHAGNFVLKGALMFTVWEAPFSRPTRDIDLLGKTDNQIGNIVRMIREICQYVVEPDGVVFDSADIEGERIIEGADYEGVRIRFKGGLEPARFSMQVDVAFGDALVPGARMIKYPTILDLPAPRLRGYSRESTVAEKFEVMVKLGILNSRLKDFFDIWFLSRQFDFGGRSLRMALEKTFSTRKTEIPHRPDSQLSRFSQDPEKQKQWRGFLRRNRLEQVPDHFPKVTRMISTFLRPVVASLVSGEPFKDVWHAPGPWSKGR